MGRRGRFAFLDGRSEPTRQLNNKKKPRKTAVQAHTCPRSPRLEISRYEGSTDRAANEKSEFGLVLNFFLVFDLMCLFVCVSPVLRIYTRAPAGHTCVHSQNTNSKGRSRRAGARTRTHTPLALDAAALV